MTSFAHAGFHLATALGANIVVPATSVPLDVAQLALRIRGDRRTATASN